MEVIYPQRIVESTYTDGNNNALVLESTIAASTAADWSSGATYSIGDTIKIIEPEESTERGIMMEYISLQNSNTGNYPYTSPSYWVSNGASERYKMFDLFSNTVSQSATDGTDITVKLACKRINKIGFLNVQASSVDISVYKGSIVTDTEIEYSGSGSDLTFSGSSIGRPSGSFITDGFKAGMVISVLFAPTNTGRYRIVSVVEDYLKIHPDDGTLNTESGTALTTITVAPIYETNINLSTALYTYHQYFFSNFEYIRDVSTDIYIPGINNVIVIITFNSYTDRSCYVGHVILGTSYDLGEARWGASTGIESYGRKVEDENFGYTYYRQGNYKKLIEFDMLIDSDKLNVINSVLTQLRETPTLWNINQGSTDYDNLLVYGVYKDFSIVHESYNQIECSLEIEGLI